MPTNFQKAKRRVKLQNGNWSDPISYATSSESVELTDGTDLQTKINSLGTAATKDVATSGNASSTQVVMGNDTRLSDSRPASDVSAWAKAPTKPTYTASEVGTYTSTEIDNKFSTLETNIDWKEAVATYSDIATTYPNPVDGWTVNVKDTDYTYRYNGTSWVGISANAIPEATTNVNGLMTTTQVTKLDGISSGAEVNQNAFSKVKVGSTTVEADSKTDTLELVAGSNVSIIPDATNDKLTINATDTTYSNATTSASGLMSATDKSKLDGIEAQANKTVVDSAMSDSSTNPLQNKVITKELEGAKTTTGNPLTIEDAAPVNAVNMSMDLEPIQAGSGTPSPDNIRPISGRSEVAIQRVGKNLFDISNADDGYIDGNGDFVSNAYFKTIKPIMIKPNNAYTLSYNRTAQASPRGMIFTWYNESGDFISQDYQNETQTAGEKTYTATSPSNAVYLRGTLYSESSYSEHHQLELGSATSYEPYAGKTYTIQIGQDVYGGTLNVTRGKMVVDRGYEDLGDLAWEYDTNVNFAPRFYTVGLSQAIKHPSSNNEVANLICEQYLTTSDAVLGNKTSSIDGGIAVNKGGIIYVKNTRYSSANAFKTAVTGVHIVYELATPFTIDLTPQQIKLLENTNTISSGGTITLEYQPNNAIGEAVRVVEENYETRVSLLENRNTAKVYGFHISSTESDPAAKVTYLADAVGMTPAYMNFSTRKFDYGSWEDVWFVRDTKPCLLKDNGQIHRYLNKNNFLKDIDGNDTGVPQITIHTMIEFPKIWYKVVPDIDGKGASIYISPVKVDADYVDYPYINYQGVHKEHFYMPAYNGSTQTESGTTYLCSTYGETVSKSLTAEQEIAYCKAHGNGWNTEDAGSIMLINFLLILMGKSTDVQSVFGQGLHTSGTEAINNGFTTGIHYNKGMFYGTNSGTIASNSYSNAVKVFGIENYWGFQWRRYAGDILVDGVRKIKLCYGNEDGSSTFDYNLTGNGYVNVGATPSGTSGGYISEMKFTNTGMYSKVSSGSSSTHYCDGQWFNNSDTRYALRGGDSADGARVGAFCVDLYTAASYAWWIRGAAPSYR